MWVRRKPRPEPQDEGPHPLRDALRAARIEAAERTGVILEMRDAELARLEILDEELDPIFAEIPSHIALFDRGISRGEVPRLWIDGIAHIEMGRDKRVYRFVQDSRLGRKVLAESILTGEIARAVTKYVARRIIERERMLAGAEPGTATLRRPGVTSAFIAGLLCGIAALLVLAWLTAR
ncbi:MAG: hypothetical protein JO228_07375 [Xanthobacteraceae bacterium]|nr:hypothetical protein [Xanthobacteraceae bacterium]